MLLSYTKLNPAVTAVTTQVLATLSLVRFLLLEVCHVELTASRRGKTAHGRR